MNSNTVQQPKIIQAIAIAAVLFAFYSSSFDRFAF